MRRLLLMVAMALATDGHRDALYHHWPALDDVMLTQRPLSTGGQAMSKAGCSVGCLREGGRCVIFSWLADLSPSSGRCRLYGQLPGASAGRQVSPGARSYSVCADGSSLCLVPGPARGRVELRHGGEWGTVCDDRLCGVNNCKGVTNSTSTRALALARVVCRQLGLPSAGAQTTFSPEVVPGSGQIWMDEVQCSGSEPALDQCRHQGWGDHGCGHEEDVGVSCQ